MQRFYDVYPAEDKRSDEAALSIRMLLYDTALIAPLQLRRARRLIVQGSRKAGLLSWVRHHWGPGGKVRKGAFLRLNSELT